MASTTALLFLSSCATAVIHALIPDHWLPFVLLARSQGWSDRRTAAMVGMAGALHVGVSLSVAAVAIALGTGTMRDLALRAGVSMGSMAGLLLVLFGLSYGLWAHRREARAHAAGEAGPSASGHVHVHGHLLERLFRGALSGAVLVVIIGISPCLLLQPILFASAAQGGGALTASAAGFAVCTLATMLGVTTVATRAVRRVELPFFTRFGDLTSGVLIAVIGVFVILQEV